MNTLKTFLKATIVGGLLFLVPVVLLLMVLRHALQLPGRIAAPIAATFPAASQSAGAVLTTLIAVLILMLIAFIAGLVARSAAGRRITAWFEESILGGMPQYRMVKSMAEGLAQIETGAGMEPVLVRGDEG
jgi:uncharacterized membrane protein